MSKKKQDEKRKPYDALPYRRGVGVALFNDAGKVFVAQRIDNPGPAWQMPQGGIDKDEAPIDAAWRELHEETGIRSAKLLAESKSWLRYDLPPDLAAQLWKGRYRGQEQKWYAFRFTGRESEVKIDGENPEFSAWKWAEFRTVPDLIVPFKRALYEQVVAEFGHLAKA
ncbi:MAG TPA: RNA pyrophosphohydrolase [Dongiaceae bacterium]|jgi:putative (di)nucleoside polyphosphate hydrolase|nr:RNA pyrophosphohydrolase [Dongiaceae bacterium]